MNAHSLRRPAHLFAFGLAAVALVGLAACASPPPAPAPPIITQFVAAGEPFTDPALVPFSWAVHDVNGDDLTCRIDFNSNGAWDVTMSPCQAAGSRNFTTGEGTYVATFEVADQDHPPVTATISYAVGAGPTETSFHIVAQQTTPPDPRVTEAIDDAVARWEAVIARGVPDTAVHSAAGACGNGSPEFDGVVDDLVVNVAVIPPFWAIGEASPCVNGPDSLPRLSFIHLNTDWIDWEYTHGYLGDIVTHEMGHALGFTGTLWWTFRQDAGVDGFRFVGPRTVAEWSRLGGESSVPLSNGTDHWNELVFRSELMTCYNENLTDHPLSAMTVASMADIGYHVDLGSAEPYTLPPEGLTAC